MNTIILSLVSLSFCFVWLEVYSGEQVIPMTQYVTVRKIPVALKDKVIERPLSVMQCAGACHQDPICHGYEMRNGKKVICRLLLEGFTGAKQELLRKNSCHVTTTFNGSRHVIKRNESGTGESWQESKLFCQTLGMRLPKYTDNNLKKHWLMSFGMEVKIGVWRTDTLSPQFYDIITNEMVNNISWAPVNELRPNDTVISLQKNGYMSKKSDNRKPLTICAPIDE